MHTRTPCLVVLLDVEDPLVEVPVLDCPMVVGTVGNVPQLTLPLDQARLDVGLPWREGFQQSDGLGGFVVAHLVDSCVREVVQ